MQPDNAELITRWDVWDADDRTHHGIQASEVRHP